MDDSAYCEISSAEVLKAAVLNYVRGNSNTHCTKNRSEERYTESGREYSMLELD